MFIYSFLLYICQILLADYPAAKITMAAAKLELSLRVNLQMVYALFFYSFSSDFSSHIIAYKIIGR